MKVGYHAHSEEKVPQPPLSPALFYLSYPTRRVGTKAGHGVDPKNTASIDNPSSNTTRIIVFSHHKATNEAILIM